MDQPRDLRADVDRGAVRLSGDRRSRCEVEDVVGSEKLTQPPTFGLAGRDRHVYAIAVVEVEGPMHGCSPKALVGRSFTGTRPYDRMSRASGANCHVN